MIEKNVNAEKPDIGCRKPDIGLEKPVDKMSHSIGQNVSQIGQNDPFHITIQDKQSKIKHSSTPSVTVGMLPSTSSNGVVVNGCHKKEYGDNVRVSGTMSGFVEPTKPQSLATMLQGFGNGKPKTKLDSKQTAYIETALVRMKVTSPSERARYQSEIAYAATQGAFSETFSHTPLKALRACLNLVEAGRWKPNVGMYV